MSTFRRLASEAAYALTARKSLDPGEPRRLTISQGFSHEDRRVASRQFFATLEKRCASRSVIIELLHLQRMLLNELAARLDLLAHQDAEHLIRLERVFLLYLEEGAASRVERRLP